jgi:hypothetical protein
MVVMVGGPGMRLFGRVCFQGLASQRLLEDMALFEFLDRCDSRVVVELQVNLLERRGSLVMPFCGVF